MSPNSASIVLDKKTQKRFAEFCFKEGYVQGRLISKLINKFLDEKEKELSKFNTTEGGNKK